MNISKIFFIIMSLVELKLQAQVLDIPSQTWVARAMPGCTQAPCQNIKDMRGLYNPDTKKSYFYGGDHSGLSGYGALYSYEAFSDVWRKIHDVCTASGTEQPAYPDEGTFVYDSLQKFIWWIPGFSHTGNVANCGSTLRHQISMSFNLDSELWTSSNYMEPSNVGSEKGIYGVYDSNTHTIIRLLGNNGTPSREIYNIALNTWDFKNLPNVPTANSPSMISTSQAAIDVIGRKIYVLDPYYDRLLVYDIDSDSLSLQSDVPFDISAYSTEWGGQFNMRLYWDSVNRVLLFPQINSNEGVVRMHAYNPNTNEWEVQKTIVTQPSGLTVRGNSGVFDPDQNVLIFYGGSGTPNSNLFLYRYASSAANPMTKPRAPTGLKFLEF